MIEKVEIGKCYFQSNTNRAYKILGSSNALRKLNGEFFYDAILIDLNNGYVDEESLLWLDHIDEYYSNEIPEDDFLKIVKAYKLYMTTVNALVSKMKKEIEQHETELPPLAT